MADYPNLLAGGVTTTTIPEPFELYAGESDIVTDQIVTGATPLLQFQVAMLVGGVHVPWDGTPGAATAIPAQPIPANSIGPAFTGGVFNHEALVWPVAADTLAERKGAFNGTNIGVRKLL